MSMSDIPTPKRGFSLKGLFSAAISWLQKLLSLQKKYGFFNIVKGLVILLLLGYVIFFMVNPTYLLDRLEKRRESQDVEMVRKRVSSDRVIRDLLRKLRDRSNADRVWLIEFHNGVSNLSSGLPFLFGSMRFEEVKEGVLNVDEEYADFLLSRYPFLIDVLSNGYFYGKVDSIQDIDSRLYYKFKSNGVEEIALIILYYGSNPLGILGVSYCKDNNMDYPLVGREIRRYGMEIGSLLCK